MVPTLALLLILTSWEAPMSSPDVTGTDDGDAEPNREDGAQDEQEPSGGGEIQTEPESQSEAGPEGAEGSESEEEPVVELPRLVDFEPAIRPEDDEDPTAEVDVLMLLQIEVDGRVSKVEILESAGAAFDDAAVTAAQGFVFEPATLDGEAIPVQIEYRYVFDPLPPAPEDVPDPVPEPGPAPDLASDAQAEDEILKADDSATIRGSPVVAEAAQIDLPAEEAERIAGTQGDSIKALQTLGGVARPSASAGELVVWGTAPSETRSYVDWIPVPRLFHYGGARSVIPTPMVETVTVVPGGVGPAYGRALGGLVRVETVAPRSLSAPRRWGAVARADAIDVGLGADTLLTDRGWAGVAVRRSVLAHTVGPLLPDTARSVVPLPTYWDYQAKAQVQLGEQDSLGVVAVGSHDRVIRSIPSLTPDQRFDETSQLGFHRIGARLLRLRGDGSSMRVAAWFGRDDQDVTQRFSTVTASTKSGIWQGGLRIAERRRVAPFLTVDVGLDAEVARAELLRQGAVTLPAREGDVVVFGQPPGDRVAEDTWVVHQGSAAGYGSLRFSWAQDRWMIEPGLRLEPLVTAVDRILPVRPIDPELGRTDVELAVDPRLRAQWRPADMLSIYAAGGRYHQAADPADRSALFGNPQLSAGQSYHAVAGVHVGPWRWVRLHAAAFFIRAQQLAVRSDEPTPDVASLLVATGQGRNVGGQVSVRLSSGPGWSADVAYSLIRAERRLDAEAGWRPFDFDQRHVLQALGGWRHRSGVELSGRLTASSGNPRTAVVDAVHDAGTGQYDPVFGAHNATRLPAFFSASARAGWGRTWSWGGLRTWLDVINVTNHRNAEEVFYTADFSGQGYVRGLPIMPSLGLEVRL